MDITYDDAVNGIKSYINNKDYEKDLSVRLSGDLRAPNPLSSVEMLDDLGNFRRKSDFVRDMLMGVSVTVKHKEEVLVSFLVNEGMQLSDIEYFQKRPGVFRFTVEAVFGIFLKNLYPLSSESQKAEE